LPRPRFLKKQEKPKRRIDYETFDLTFYGPFGRYLHVGLYHRGGDGPRKGKNGTGMSPQPKGRNTL